MNTKSCNNCVIYKHDLHTNKHKASEDCFYHCSSSQHLLCFIKVGTCKIVEISAGVSVPVFLFSLPSASELWVRKVCYLVPITLFSCKLKLSYVFIICLVRKVVIDFGKVDFTWNFPVEISNSKKILEHWVLISTK